MKRFFYGILAALAVIACETKPQEEQLSFSVTPSSVSFKASDSSAKLLNISTNGSWSVSATDNWIHLDKTSGTGNGAVTVTVDENGGEARQSSIRLQATKGSKELSSTVSVSQEESGNHPVVPSPAAFDGNKRASTTYQLLVYSFADSNGDGVGDFNGIASKLDYLDELGVTALWLSPAHPTSSYHGYDVNDYNALNPAFGTEADFKSLIDKAHEKGIKIYMDFVLNHSGSNHPWFKSVKEDPKNSPYRDYYVLSTGDYPSSATGGMGGWHSLGDGNIGYDGRLKFEVTFSGGKPARVTVTQTTEAPTGNVSNPKVWIYTGDNLPMKETDGSYELVADIHTSWGFLVRTSTTSWDNNTKWGAAAGKTAITFGQPLSLTSNDPQDIVFGETTSYYASFDGSMPDLNYGKPSECQHSAAFKATVESAAKWVNMGVDGFRLDAVVWVYGASATDNARFLKQWYSAVNEAYKAAGHADDIFMVGEAWYNGHGEEAKYYQGLPSCFEFDYWGKLKNAVNGTASGYASAVMGFIADHAAQRGSTAPAAITSFHMTNHDQDRAAGELGKDLAKEKQAAAMLLTTPGKPFIYQGEELGYWGTKSGGDEYVRTPILWDKAGKDCAKKGVNNKVDNSMLKAGISVEAQLEDENSLLAFYQSWSRLRNTYPALATGEMTKTSISGSTIASWYMSTGEQKLLVIHNGAGTEKTVSVSDSMAKPVALLGSATTSGNELTLGAHSSVVFEL